jgi:3-deoxy-D-manno-octulosonic-acid transferase
VRAADAADALRLAAAIAGDPARRAAMGAAGREFVAAHRGAVQRLVDLAGELLAARRGAP